MEDEMELKITWYGHSAFRLQAGGESILVDPFIGGNPSATVTADEIDAGTILLTHAHNDHVGDTVAIAKRSSARVIATFELANWVRSQGVADVDGGNFGGTMQFPGGTVKFVPAWHTSSFATRDGVVASGVPAGLVVRFGGKTIYFAGDTCLFLDMQLIGEEGLDVAVLPIGDKFTMGPKDAARAAGFLRAKTIIPCHYNTFPPIEQDPDGFRSLVESTTDSKVVVLEPGKSTEL
jgi:L-ascorbate metabolism protein UlaG (beta-lactamase superfamily)